MNKFTGIGNLTRDPEFTTLASGVAVCKFTVAINRKFADKDGNRDTDYLNCVTWRALAENCSKSLKKGSKIGIAGAIQTRSYEAQDGTKRSVTELIADEVEFLSKNNNTQGDASSDGVGASQTEMTPVSDDNLPF